MARPEKIARVEMIREKFLNHRIIFLADYKGLTVDEINGLRYDLREKGAEFRVLKNTLTRLAIKDTEYEELERFFVGPVAAAFVSEDPMAVARELVAFTRKNKNLVVKGGYMEGRSIEASQIKIIATLPSRDVLMARLAGSLLAPLYRFSNVLSGPCRKLVYALQAVSEAKSEAA